MSEFFDNYLNIKNILKDKQEYRDHMARVKALPEDYQYVYDKIQGYMWKFASGHGYDMQQVQYDLIDLFENGAAESKHVLEVTGEDVASFADELLKSAQTYTENWHDDLNKDIQKRFGRGRS